MKNKKVLLFSLAASVSSAALMAQTGQWKLAGNSLTGTEKLGSINNLSVDFISNNVKRMSLTNTGNLKFDSDQSSIQFPNPGASPKPMMFIYQSGNINTARMVMAYSPAFPNYGLKYNGFDKFEFTDGLSTALGVDLTNKRVGVGTLTPQSRIHVFNGASGTTPFSPSTLTIESSTNNYMSVLAPTSVETGILFGHNLNNISGGIIYNNPGTKNGLQFRTKDNSTRMILTSDGNLGVVADPGPYTTKISHSNAGSKLGLDIANTSDGGDWEIFARANKLDLFGNGFFKGSFSADDGTYTSVSDERLKTNIQPMSAVLEKILKLRPVNYQMKNTKEKQQHDGFIAQDVMKIFPTLVTHNVNKERNLDVYTMNYSGFGVIAIKAIQELIKVNEEKDTKIESLQSQIDELKAIVIKRNQTNETSGSSESRVNTIVTDASLEQNMPNPFSGTTVIRYTIPQKFNSAQIIITDQNGKAIKQLSISGGKGVVNVDAIKLSPGAYHYSLVVDGKKIDTKQMMLMK